MPGMREVSFMPREADDRINWQGNRGILYLLAALEAEHNDPSLEEEEVMVLADQTVEAFLDEQELTDA